MFNTLLRPWRTIGHLRRCIQELEESVQQAKRKQIQAEREAKAWREQRGLNQERVCQLEHELAQTRVAMGLLARLEIEPPSESQITGCLQGASENTDWWRAMLHVLRRQIAEEESNAKVPGLSSEDRHYNAGRAAGLSDHLDCLIQLNIKAREPK